MIITLKAIDKWNITLIHIKTLHWQQRVILTSFENPNTNRPSLIIDIYNPTSNEVRFHKESSFDWNEIIKRFILDCAMRLFTNNRLRSFKTVCIVERARGSFAMVKCTSAI